MKTKPKYKGENHILTQFLTPQTSNFTTTRNICNRVHSIYTNHRIIRSQENKFWQIRRGGQSTNIFFRGNRDGSWNKIRVITGYFIPAGPIINGNGMVIQSLATKIIWKGIIEAFINCPVVLIYCWNFCVLTSL